MSAERKVRASMRRKIFMNSYPNIFTFTVSADTGVSADTSQTTLFELWIERR